MDFTTLPETYRVTIPESYLDEMGHMNVMWYIHLFSKAAGGLFQRFGLDEPYFRAHHAGTFALEMHVRYLAEVRVGQTVTIRSRVLGRSAKRLHFMHFMLHESGVLAATEEAIATHVDMTTRRTSPLSAEATAAFDRLLGVHAGLGWDAPVCGVMNP